MKNFSSEGEIRGLRCGGDGGGDGGRGRGVVELAGMMDDEVGDDELEGGITAIGT